MKHPRSTASFGKLRMWIDIYPIDEAKKKPMTDITVRGKTHIYEREDINLRESTQT